MMLLRYAVDRPVIWNVMSLMWRHCNNNVVLQMISFPIKMCGCFFCSQSWHAVEQIVKRVVIWGAMALMWSHCNDNAAKRNFGITNDYVSSERVLMFPLLLLGICRWTNNRVAGHLTHHDAHAGSLREQCFKTLFQYYKWFRPQLKCLYISLALSRGMLLSKLSSRRWFHVPWCSSLVTVMTMLQNAISQMADSRIGMGNLIRSGMIYYKWLRF